MKYSFFAIDATFKPNDNILTKYLVKYEYTGACEEADVLFIGSFINEHLYNHYIKNLNCIKILYVTEPIQFMHGHYSYKLYSENLVNICFGCVENDGVKNFKHPIWYEMAGPKRFYDDVFIFDDVNIYVKDCENFLNKRYCSLINSHDRGGTRVPMYNKLKDFGFIECPSKLLNNCSSSEIDSYAYNNGEYLKLFKFNICSENHKTTIDGYFTEKLVNASFGGAIPIYCGFFGETEDKIFNKDRILFYDSNDEESMDNVRNKVELLLNNDDKFIEFYKQPVFKETAYETVMTFDINLLNMIRRINAIHQRR